jgi:hypothetical protein
MPCQSGPDYQTEHSYKAELDKVTRLLCYVMAHQEAMNLGRPFQVRPSYEDELQAWWAAHKALDEERRKQILRERHDAIQKVEFQIRQLEKQLNELKTT